MARPKLTEEEKQKRKEERKKQKELQEKAVYQEKLEAGYTPIEDILKENEQEAAIQEDKNINRKEEASNIKNFFAGLGSSLATTPTDLVALGEMIPRTVEGLTRAAIDPNVSVKEGLIDSLLENETLKASQAIDEKVRDTLGVKHQEDLSSNEQLASLSGELFPLIASGGSKGLINLGKGLQRAALRSAKKKAVKSGKALSSDVIKKTKDNVDLATGFVLPGVQITKGASKGQQLAELGVQAGIPLGINEAIRAASNQEGIIGDYTEKEPKNFTLIKDKRYIRGKDFAEDVKPGIINEYTLDDRKQEEEFLSDTTKNVALIGAGILGSSVAVRKLRNLVNKEVDSVVNSNNTESFIDNLSLPEQLDISMADRFAFRNKAVNEGLLKEETANALSQDMHSKINSAFNTGKIDETIQLNVAPQATYNKLQALKVHRPQDYDNLEKFLEINSLVQDEANSYNKFFNYSNISTDEYIKKVLTNDIVPEAKTTLSNKTKLANSIKVMKKLQNVIESNPETKQLLTEISDIGKALLDSMQKSNMFNPNEIEYLKRNRTIDGLFLYKPRIADTKQNLRERLSNYFLKKTPFNKLEEGDKSVRGLSSITKSKNYLDVFEKNFKQTLLDIHDNTVKRDALKQMTAGSFSKIKNKLSEYDNTLLNIDINTSKDKLPNIDKITNDYAKQIDKLFTARPIGAFSNTGDTIDIMKPKGIFDLLNVDKNKLNKLHNLLDINYSQKKGVIAKNIATYKASKDIISYMEDGVEYLYKVDPVIKAAFDLNPSMPSLIAESMKSLKNLVQTTITGALNPFFAIPSSLMTTQEALTVMPKIASKLKSVDNFSRLGYLKEIGKSFTNILLDDITNNIIRKYDKEVIRTYGKMDSTVGKLLQKVNIENLRHRLNNTLLTQIKQAGGASAKPFNTNRGIYYTLNKDTKLTEATEKVLSKVYGIDGAVQVINLFNYLQQAIREAPSLALTTYMGKAGKAIKDDKIVNLKEMNKIIDTIGSNTANVGKRGSGKGFSGSFARIVEDYVPYGNVMIKSLAPKIRASGLDKGISNLMEISRDLYDPNVRYLDILQRIQKNGKELVQNKFIEGLMLTSIVPSLISYVWNYGSQQNMNSYHSLSEYDKASKFILTNFFGKDKHLILPKDQEVALCDSLFTELLDNILGMSKYNEVDPAFDQSKVVMQSLARSIGIDSIPILDIIGNVSGYDINLNVLSNRPFITNLKHNAINRDLSETAYQNGLVNQETTQLINSIIGVFGSTVLGSFEEANVGARNDTGLEDFGSALFDKFTKSAQLITGNKAISSYNATSKAVYEKQALINKIASIKNKTPKQQEIYNFIRMYKNNRINPIHENVTELRNSINTVRSNGKMADGSILDYEGRRVEINNLNKQLQRLFAREYHEYNNLDKLIEQMYGKDINLENFMEKFNG